MKNKVSNNNLLLLSIILIFIVAIIVRLLYFPKNVYFSFDQARDFYFAQDILKGDIRLIGPPSAASQKLFPGPLSLYIYAFIQLLFGKNPELMSLFFRIYNAAGVFLVFLIGSKLINKKIGILTAILFAFSYEQSQYALIMSHQPLAVLSVLLFYLGLVIFVFEKKHYGVLLASLGLGLSIQFHYVYVFLIPIVCAVLFLYKKDIPKLKAKSVLISASIFMLTIATYIISEFKFKFRILTAIFATEQNSLIHPKETLYAIERFIHDSFGVKYSYSLVILAIFFIFLFSISKSGYKKKIIFLLIWFLGGILPYFVTGTQGYYYSAAASVSLLILFTLLIESVYKRIKVLGIFLFLLVLLGNYFLIKEQNPKGPNLEIVIQPGMLITDEKRALDFIYQSAEGERFAVKALGVPLNINTTWSYLFEWYGYQKYGYLPTWSEKPAEGFPGGLPYSTKRSVLSGNQYIIVEPLNGIPKAEIEKFFAQESYFTKLEEEKEFGTILVQKRSKI